MGGIMQQRIAMRYARHRHKTFRTTGHLFEQRYGARLITLYFAAEALAKIGPALLGK
jgi:hypothetical protein